VQHQKQQDIHTLYNSNTLGLYCICLESQLVFWWFSSASLPNAVVPANESWCYPNRYFPVSCCPLPT